MADSERNAALKDAVERLEEGGAEARLWIDRVRGEAVGVALAASALTTRPRSSRTPNSTLSTRKLGRLTANVASAGPCDPLVHSP